MRRRRAQVVTSRVPLALERKYRAMNLRLVDLLRKQIDLQLVPAYDAAYREHFGTLHGDSWGDYLEAAVQGIRMSVQEPLFRGRRMLVELSEQVATWSEIPWKRLAEAQTSVDIFKRESWLKPMLKSWSDENSKLISSIPERYLSSVAQRAQDMIRQGRPMSFFKAELMKQYNISANRAQLIARTEVAKLNGQITKARQQGLGLQEYTWTTSADERVRSSHKALNGKICRYDNPEVYRNEGESEWRSRASLGAYIGDPGEDFQCRCTASANVEEFLDNLLGEA